MIHALRICALYNYYFKREGEMAQSKAMAIVKSQSQEALEEDYMEADGPLLDFSESQLL